MNAKTIASAFILSFATIGAAQAATPRGDSNNVPFQGVYGQADTGATRAQVIVELQQARTAGLTSNVEINNAPFTAQADNGASRAQIRADIDSGNTTSSLAFGDVNNQPFQGV
ncbi:DUF4148 domain-containing protein [Bordetella flabilis]|uniref:DUF4148 domain-containing protein n=1 Tax=Bordetella flabilis TaxID=463014 RepID=A0A193GDR7_9BORD|nr:DUF4148 domain-containing protein [Bordetella flabilis]ANN77429.1 hypothetical protein BAU07_10235 [Bordetella flabilis]